MELALAIAMGACGYIWQGAAHRENFLLATISAILICVFAALLLTLGAP